MKIVIIGTGYVGLVSGACLADFGHFVTCVDSDDAKVSALRAGVMPIWEPGLEALVLQNVQHGRLSFTTNLSAALANRPDAVFIAVGTPARRGDGHADLSYVYAAAKEVAETLSASTIVVTKSTVPVGTGDEIAKVLSENGAPNGTLVASNPEFLREGAALRDFKIPDRVVVGAEDEHAREVLRDIYRPLFINKSPILFTRRRTAELIKYAANAFLATKISFINEIADLCEAVGADVQEVAQGIGLDNRIGSKFLHAGPGYGGSCFPKDTLALLQTAQEAGVQMRIVNSVVEVNDARKAGLGDRVRAAVGDLQGKRVAVLGLTFKPNTDDMRDAPSLALIERLQAFGARVVAFDPVGRKQAEPLMSGVDLVDDIADAVRDADAVVLVTEWDEFRALDFQWLAETMSGKAFIDLRNVYGADEVSRFGLTYHGVGRGSPRTAQ